jgi:hypothetical protein
MGLSAPSVEEHYGEHPIGGPLDFFQKGPNELGNLPGVVWTWILVSPCASVAAVCQKWVPFQVFRSWMQHRSNV